MDEKTKSAEQTLQDDKRCFGCGPENEGGLQLVFFPQEDGSVRGDIVLRDTFQGWKGIAHGGIVMMLLDEAMAHAGVVQGHYLVTAGVQVRFKKPTPLNVPLVVTGRMGWQRRRVFGMKAELHDAHGTLLAISEGEFISRGPADLENFNSRLPEHLRIVEPRA